MVDLDKLDRLFRRAMFVLLRPRKQWLWHDDSPGMKVLVVRTWIGRLLKPRDFATCYEQTYTDQPGLPPLYRPWHMEADDGL